MNARSIALLLLLAATEGIAEEKPGPYVNVYHDDTVALQVRHDRIKTLGDKLFEVWLRWLWAEPQAWKSQQETATVRIVDLDCINFRVREITVLHKNRKGEIFDVEQWKRDQAPWKVIRRNTGAGDAISKVCEFVPKLIEANRQKK